MIDVLITLLIYCIIFAIAFAALSKWPVPAPFGAVLYTILAVIAIILLLGLAGVFPGDSWRIHASHWRR